MNTYDDIRFKIHYHWDNSPPYTFTINPVTPKDLPIGALDSSASSDAKKGSKSPLCRPETCKSLGIHGEANNGCAQGNFMSQLTMDF
jgi:hypothetical protein